MSDKPKCELCGEPMPDGEEMFKYHGYSGPCPKPPLPKHKLTLEDTQQLLGSESPLTVAQMFGRMKQAERELIAAYDDLESAKVLIRSFDAAIRHIAAELTGQACGGVDTGDELNPETGEPYGHGGHTGWLLAKEAKKLREERDRYKADSEQMTAKYAEMATITEPFRASNFGQLLKLWNYEQLGDPNTGLIPIDASVKIQVSVRDIRKVEEALSNLPASVEKLLAIKRAAEGHFEWHRDRGDGTTCSICNAVRALQEKP